jgi:hypothetical protein
VDCRIGFQVECGFGISVCMMYLVWMDEFHRSKIESGSVEVLEYSMMRISPSRRKLILKQSLVYKDHRSR